MKKVKKIYLAREIDGEIQTICFIPKDMINKIYLIEEIDSEIHNICFTSKEAAIDYIRNIVKAEIDNIMNNEEIYMDMFGYQPDKIDENNLFRDFMESFRIKEIEVKV